MCTALSVQTSTKSVCKRVSRSLFRSVSLLLSTAFCLRHVTVLEGMKFLFPLLLRALWWFHPRMQGCLTHPPTRTACRRMLIDFLEFLQQCVRVCSRNSGLVNGCYVGVAMTILYYIERCKKYNKTLITITNSLHAISFQGKQNEPYELITPILFTIFLDIPLSVQAFFLCVIHSIQTLFPLSELADQLFLLCTFFTGDLLRSMWSINYFNSTFIHYQFIQYSNWPGHVCFCVYSNFITLQQSRKLHTVMNHYFVFFYNPILFTILALFSATILSDLTLNS